ncbi:MAG TPA: NTP transferase domain-containing protein, partial [Pseudomonadales bacterium]|nr:NTP transferase domain-containing protein [Pseudomonadales bacterium]
MNEKTWAVVLAAGEGSRLHDLTTTSIGVAVPKQFCSLHGGPSLLQDALRRAQSVAPPERVCAIVASQHRPWWRDLTQVMPERNVIVQPHNRGTGIGILLPLLHVMARDPEARVVLLPSDHHVCDEGVLARALRSAVLELETRPN